MLCEHGLWSKGLHVCLSICNGFETKLIWPWLTHLLAHLEFEPGLYNNHQMKVFIGHMWTWGLIYGFECVCVRPSMIVYGWHFTKKINIFFSSIRSFSSIWSLHRQLGASTWNWKGSCLPGWKEGSKNMIIIIIVVIVIIVVTIITISIIIIIIVVIIIIFS